MCSSTSLSLIQNLHVAERFNQIRKAKKNFIQLHGRDPSVSEYAEATGLSEEHVQAVLDHKGTTSLDDLVYEEGELDQVYEDSELEPGFSDLVDDIKEVLFTLPVRQRDAIWYRYGLDMPTGKAKLRTLDAVGVIMGVTRERIRQLERSAIENLEIILSDRYKRDDVAEILGDSV